MNELTEEQKLIRSRKFVASFAWKYKIEILLLMILLLIKLPIYFLKYSLQDFFKYAKEGFNYAKKRN